MGLFAAFALLTGATIYISHRSWDGLVDRRYSETAANEFAEREAEVRAGFTAVLPDRVRAGENRFRAVLSTSAGPLRGARVTLDAMRIDGPRNDRSFPLREEAPGAYAADVFLPLPGRWTFSLSVDADPLHARRRWTAEAKPSDEAGILRGVLGGREVLLSITPWPPSRTSICRWRGWRWGGTASISPAGRMGDTAARGCSSGARAEGATGKRR